MSEIGPNKYNAIKMETLYGATEELYFAETNEPHAMPTLW